MVREDLVAERIAIDHYREMIDYIGGRDPTTRRLLEEILAVEEEHAEDLSSLLDGVASRNGGSSSARPGQASAAERGGRRGV